MAARGTPPGRSSAGSPRQATMVDSTPTGVAPPSMIRSMRPRRSASTCWAVVGETCPERLAEGATTGRPKAMRMSRATGWSGTRTAMLSRPAVARSATAQVGAFGSTSVSGPGQSAAASRSAVASNCASFRAAARSRDMGDQRIERGSALGVIEARHRDAVLRVSAKAIDGLGRKGDEPAGRKAARRGRDRLGIPP